MAKLLVVDDEQAICWGLERIARQMGHEAVTASSAEQALERLKLGPVDAMVLDVRLPGMDGLTAIEHLRAACPGAPIIVITAHGDLPTAVNAVRQGAAEYLLKPFSAEQIKQAMARALAHPTRRPAAAVEQPTAGLIGQSPAMQQVYGRIALAASGDVPVLLQGESGVGKELAARAIHAFSSRAGRPFVAVNVAALAPSLAESELFGHARGAFTGAEAARHGLLAQAAGGTLFLDEIGEVPLPIQVKLLRALEQGEILPVGADRPVKTEFRLITATHRQLLELVRQESFRHDLYFRVSAFQIDLPPLRERTEDIADLAAHFARELHAAAAISQEALRELASRPWRGNVRELRNAMQHALLSARGGVILPHHLPPPTDLAPADLVAAESRGPSNGAGQPAIEVQLARWLAAWTQERLRADPETDRLHDDLLAAIEPAVLRSLLAHHSGRAIAVARTLGLHRTTVRKKLDQYGLPDDPQGE